MSSFANFKFLSVLGKGSYSQVYKVRRKLENSADNQQIYALKKVYMNNLTEKERANALNEVRLLASIRHPNIISYKEAFIDESTSCLCVVMEYADKGDAFQLLNDHQNEGQYFKEKQIWTILIQATHGLQHLHEMSILHRDLKCANLFLFKNGDVKIGDLNVSKVARAGLSYTQTGTPYYASPEVWNDLPYDSKSDIWSLGIVMYEITALHLPFQAKSMDGLYDTVRKGEYEPIPKCFSVGLSRVISAMLQLNPENRPSCQQLMSSNLFSKWMNKIDPDNLYCTESTRCFSLNRTSISDISNELIDTIKVSRDLRIQENYLPKPNYEDSFITLKPSIKIKKVKTKKPTRDETPKKPFFEDAPLQAKHKGTSRNDLKKPCSHKNSVLANNKELKKYLKGIPKYKGLSSLKVKLEMKEKNYSSVESRRETFGEPQGQGITYREESSPSMLEKHNKNTLSIPSIKNQKKGNLPKIKSALKIHKKHYEEIAKRFMNLTPEHKVTKGKKEIRAKVMDSLIKRDVMLTPQQIKLKVPCNENNRRKALLPSINTRKSIQLSTYEHKPRKNIDHHSLEITSCNRPKNARYKNETQRRLSKMLNKLSHEVRNQPLQLSKARICRNIYKSRDRLSLEPANMSLSKYLKE
ncbi:unnamed protein product [Moneuplotes crassus]|uniref:non-specific serine/threonine protein kinase n=1 Tax=Euplotes crassus TaxID=5936 RepID=A0AAD1X2V6_EUPCR|nr:unnamed protein product [Moneuplotes crassus]